MPRGFANPWAHDINARVAFSPRDRSQELILDGLKSAQQSVDVAMFYLSNDVLSDALCCLAKKGVAVRLFVDEEAAKPARRPLLDRLSSYGVQVFVEHLESGGKLHMKCAVIDREKVITGAANWTDYAFELNYEDVILISSLSLAQQYEQALNDLLKQCIPFTSDESESIPTPTIHFPDATPSAGSPAHTFTDIVQAKAYFTPGREGLAHILSLARASTNRIDMGMYIFSDIEAMTNLCEIAKAGRTQIHLFVDHIMLSGAYLSVLQKLYDAGVDIQYVSEERAILHLKVIVIDGRYIWSGSANWTTDALDENVENQVFIESEQMAHYYMSYFDEIRTKSKPYSAISLQALVSAPAVEKQQPTLSGGWLTGLPPSSTRTNYALSTRRKADEPALDVTASVQYIKNGDYLPIFLKLVQEAQQSIFISMFEVPKRKTGQAYQEKVFRALADAVSRGIYVCLLLHMPPEPNDPLFQAHSELAERLRGEGIDVRLVTPTVPLHEKMVVVDLAKVLVGTHNWSDGSLSGDRVYECSAFLVLSQPDIRLADHFLRKDVIQDMTSREAWEREINLIRHAMTLSRNERSDFMKKIEDEAP